MSLSSQPSLSIDQVMNEPKQVLPATSPFFRTPYSNSETSFDDLTLLACQLCGTPIALVALLDENREWFKFSKDITAGDHTFDSEGILQDEIFIVTDAQVDSRFADSPLVLGDAKIRFYAGAPLFASGGQKLGILRVMDQLPRELTSAQKFALKTLSRQVVAQLESQHNLTEMKKTVVELERAQEELKWKTAFLEALINSSPDGIMVVDQHNKKILQNQRTTELYKIPSVIANGEDYQMQLQWVAGTTKHPEDFLAKVIGLYSRPNETSRDEIELKDGTTLDRYSSPTIGQDGKYYGRIWIFRDITERKRIEARLFQSQKMETVGQLAGGFAHEFNSILTIIIGQSELLFDGLSAGSTQVKNAFEIKKAAGRAATLTRQLLAYGRKQFLQSEPMDLNRVIAGMENIFHKLVGPEVETLIVPAVDLQMAQADATQIEQVIVNLINNARDAMPHGGKLTLETANISIDRECVGFYPELKPGNYVMLAVSDTGRGMGEEVRKRLFEPFFSTKGVGEGVGLGLSTCYGIIKQSGGHISVYSELALGTTFKIFLPQIGPLVKFPDQNPRARELPHGTEKILLVEDDPALREMAATLLRQLGYSIMTAANGIEALNLKPQSHIGGIDLLFTDVTMPHMSGTELALKMQSLFPKIKILFTSGYTENFILQQGILKKGMALLQKPFTPAALAIKVRLALDTPILTA
jgi:two-component system cell cycle sensor histidine kinase/response regulator CckA